jgi:hypothetical protein
VGLAGGEGLAGGVGMAGGVGIDRESTLEGSSNEAS